MSEGNRKRYIEFLRSAVERYVGKLEVLLGPRDKRFVFGTIEKSCDDRPRNHFPNKYYTTGGCVVDIHITEFPWEHCSRDQGRWQVAHESLHLIDPGEEGTIVLEEGLASWFQNEPRFHSSQVRKYIETNSSDSDIARLYREARQLVIDCKPDRLVKAVKEIRKSDIRIRCIKPEMLEAHLRGVNRSTIEELCKKFKG